MQQMLSNLTKIAAILVCVISAGCAVTVRPLTDADDSYEPKKQYTFSEMGWVVAVAEICRRHFNIRENDSAIATIKEKVAGLPRNSDSRIDFYETYEQQRQKFKSVDVLTGNSRQWCGRYKKDLAVIAKQIGL